MRTFKVIYKDRFGEINSTIFTDGSRMQLVLRDIKFNGADFDMLHGKLDESKFDYYKYKDGSADLTNFSMNVYIPVYIIHENILLQETIKFYIQVGDFIDNTSETINTVECIASFGTFTLNKKIDYFENSLIDLQNLFPVDYKIKTCLSCKFSNYHPVGNGTFGGMYCFRNLKEEVLLVNDKSDLMNLWSEENFKNEIIFNVQETYDCPQHEFLAKNEWSYKDWHNVKYLNT